MAVIRIVLSQPSPPVMSWLDLGQVGLRTDTWLRDEAAVGELVGGGWSQPDHGLESMNGRWKGLWAT